jgi:hypothetical protein
MAAQSTLKKAAPVEEVAQTVVVKREPEKDLFAWRAPARPFKRRGREFWVKTVAIAGVVGLILFLIEGFMPVILIISLVFLFYILTTVEPEEIEYKVTNKGVKIAGRRTEWGLLTRYWFSRRSGNELLVFEILTLPGRLELVVNSKEKEAIKKALSAYLPEEEAPPTNLDKVANWFSKKLPQ